MIFATAVGQGLWVLVWPAVPGGADYRLKCGARVYRLPSCETPNFSLNMLHNSITVPRIFWWIFWWIVLAIVAVQTTIARM